MGKNLAIKLVIVLVVAALIFSVFWFFKVGQVEKQITNFISENSNYVSSGEISVSGFPLSQKITIKDFKFTIPSPLLNKRQTIVKNLELKSGIFSSDFSVVVSEGVSVQDLDGKSSVVEFNKNPEITISFLDGRIAKFNYQDSGYKILDAEKKVIYAAASSIIAIESIAGDDEKITTKIAVNVNSLEEFGIIDVYKNAFEKKIIEGMKTGEITLGSGLITPDASVAMTMSATPEAPQVDSAAIPAVPAPENQAPVVAVDPMAANVAVAVAQEAPAVPSAPVVAEALKSNLVLSAEYILTPNKSDQQAKIPTDPTQIQEVPVQYNKIIKITNLEFSNSLYKILINGEINSHIDDNMPSGSLAVKVEKIDSLIDLIKSDIAKIIEEKTPTPAPAPVEAMPNESLTVNSTATVEENSYHNFLQKISTNFSPVIKELAAKNAVSKENIAEFDIRREKNLEFLINETSTREILGKF